MDYTVSDIEDIPHQRINVSIVTPSHSGGPTFIIYPVIDEDLSNHLSWWIESRRFTTVEDVEVEIKNELARQQIEKTREILTKLIPSSGEVIQTVLNDLIERIKRGNTTEPESD